VSRAKSIYTGLLILAQNDVFDLQPRGCKSLSGPIASLIFCLSQAKLHKESSLKAPFLQRAVKQVWRGLEA
jgi:hypothetical protein